MSPCLHPSYTTVPSLVLCFRLSSNHFQDGTQVTVRTQGSDEDSFVTVRSHGQSCIFLHFFPSLLSLLTHFLVSQVHFFPGPLLLLCCLPRIFHPSPRLVPPLLSTRPTPFPSSRITFPQRGCPWLLCISTLPHHLTYHFSYCTDLK